LSVTQVPVSTLFATLWSDIDSKNAPSVDFIVPLVYDNRIVASSAILLASSRKNVFESLWLKEILITDILPLLLISNWFSVPVGSSISLLKIRIIVSPIEFVKALANSGGETTLFVTEKSEKSCR